MPRHDSADVDVQAMNHTVDLLTRAMATCSEAGQRERMIKAATLLGFVRDIDRMDPTYVREVILPELRSLFDVSSGCHHSARCGVHALIEHLSQSLERMLPRG